MFSFENAGGARVSVVSRLFTNKYWINIVLRLFLSISFPARGIGYPHVLCKYILKCRLKQGLNIELCQIMLFIFLGVAN